MEMNLKQALSWERLAQFHLIEVIALWEGRLTSNHLQQAFSIGRSKASEIFGAYQQCVPGNICHNTQARGYVPEESFAPRFSQGLVHEYLDLLHKSPLCDSHYFALQTGRAPIDRLQPLTRPVNPDAVRVIIQAVREKKRISACYRSLSKPDGGERLMAPHTLVSAAGRWHVRAFCEDSRVFKDFMLHRFVAVPEIETDRLEIADPSRDKEWGHQVEMVLVPNPALSPLQQQLVADDYAMGTARQLRLKVRAPLVKYMAVELRIDSPEQTRENPNAHQLDLANRDELSGLIL